MGMAAQPDPVLEPRGNVSKQHGIYADPTVMLDTYKKKRKNKTQTDTTGTTERQKLKTGSVRSL